MTPEAWGFFTADSLAMITLMGQQLDARRKARVRDKKVDKVVENTASISNGAIPGLVQDVKLIKGMMIDIGARVGVLEDKGNAEHSNH